MDATMLIEKLHKPMASTEDAIANAIAVYRDADARRKALADVQAQAKALIEEIIIETGQDKWETPAGKCQITKPGVTVRWNAKHLDALMASSDDLARILAPHRSETERPGTLRITK
jgi:hypothetical protein